MLANRRRNTFLELRVRRCLHAAGARYRIDFAPDPSDLRRRADIVFTRARVSVFLDGCFWHGCPVHYVEPKSNAEYWRPKIAGNIARDAETRARLEDLGWVVLRFWEHEAPEDIVVRILETVRGNRPSSVGR